MSQVTLNPIGEPAARFLPERALPPYTHVPGVTPHPVSHPDGHSFGSAPEHVGACDPENWRSNSCFLWGVDLFNAGYYWEAHESWETLWKACSGRGPVADFLKALIKLAAAGVKLRERNQRGVRRHLLRATALLDGVLAQHGCRPVHLFGLDCAELRRACELAAAASWPEPPRDGTPVRVFTFLLRPADDAQQCPA